MPLTFREAVYRAALEQLRRDQEDAELRRTCEAFADGVLALETLVKASAPVSALERKKTVLH